MWTRAIVLLVQKIGYHFMQFAEAFLAKHLGGMCEPIDKDFEGANFTVPAGADEIPGLTDALKKKL
jgi:hypothetical protein